MTCRNGICKSSQEARILGESKIQMGFQREEDYVLLDERESCEELGGCVEMSKLFRYSSRWTRGLLPAKRESERLTEGIMWHCFKHPS